MFEGSRKPLSPLDIVQGSRILIFMKFYYVRVSWLEKEHPSSLEFLCFVQQWVRSPSYTLR